MKPLTKNQIKRQRPKHVRFDLPDDKITGLAVAVFPPSKRNPSGVKSWTLRYTVKGKIYRYTIGHWPTINIQNARKIAGTKLREVAEGKNPQREKIESRQRRALGLDREDNFATAWNDYITKYVKKKLKPSTAREIERIGQKLVLPKIGKRMLKEIEPREVKALISKIAEHAPIGANRVLAVLSAFWNWSINELIVDKNPCVGLVRPNSEKLRKRKRILSDREIRWFWKACDKVGYPFGPLMKIALITGARRGEVAAMEREELVWQDRVWILGSEKTKNKRGHTVYITDLFKSIIEPLSTPKFVFSKGKTPPSGFSRAKRNIDKYMGEFAKEDFEQPPAEWHVHDLRRTCASGMAKLKPRVNLATVELCLNHWSGELGGLREVYIQPDQADDMADAWRRWTEHVTQIVQ